MRRLFHPVVYKGDVPGVRFVQKIMTPTRPRIGVIQGNRITLLLEKKKLNLIPYISTISKL
jgi:hypothetical protein